MESGPVASKYDHAILTWYLRNQLQSIIPTHVQNFQSRVLNRLCYIFAVKSEEDTKFQNIGLNIKNKRGNIKLGQTELGKKLKYMPDETGRNLKNAIFTTEITETRQISGKGNWPVTQTRPDLSDEVIALSSIQKQKNVECIKWTNRKIKKAKKISDKYYRLEKPWAFKNCGL